MSEQIIKLNIKPLSVNKAFQGRRFKTNAYKEYEANMLSMLPELVVPEYPLKLLIEVGFSSRASDLDNMLKQTIDILCKRYNFDDKHIYEIFARKVIVNKGCEFIAFRIDHSDRSTDRI